MNQDNFPLAYLLTFRTYGTWHHGDPRGSVDRRFYNSFRTPKIPSSPSLIEAERSIQKFKSIILDEPMQSVAAAAIRDVCSHRGYVLRALNIRSNHGHVVVSGNAKPEKIEAFKSYSTRSLRNAGLVDTDCKIWSRHGSTRYLWKQRFVNAAIDYVLYFQGDEFPSFDEVLE